MENPNLRYSAYLAMRHPFISKKASTTLADLPPVFEPEKIVEDTMNLKGCLKQLLFFNFIRKKVPEKTQITIYRTEPAQTVPSLQSLDTPELLTDFQKKRRLQLSSSVIGESAKKLQIIRPQRTYNLVAEHFATEGNRTLRQPVSARCINEAEDKLPAIDFSKNRHDHQPPIQSSGQSSDSPLERRTRDIVPKKITPYTKFVPSDSPKKRDQQIKEILERIVLKEKESKDQSENIAKKLTDGATFTRTKTIDQKTPGNKNSYRRELSLNFSSARPSNKAKIEEGSGILRNKTQTDQGIFDLKQLNLADRFKIKEKELSRLPKGQKIYKLGTSSKIKFTKQSTPLKSLGQQEGGTISTQDY